MGGGTAPDQAAGDERRDIESAALAALAEGADIDLSGFDEPIRAEVVAALVQGDHGSLPRTGVTIIGAEIEGPIMLGNAVIEVPLALHQCRVPDGIDLSQAKLHSLLLSETHVGPAQPDDDTDMPVVVAAPSSTVGLDVVLRGCTVHGIVWLASAAIGGDLLVSDTIIETGGANLGLLVDDTTVRGSVRIVGGTHPGGTSADRADVGGNLTFQALDDAGPISLDGVHVAHDLLVAGLERCRWFLAGDARIDGVLALWTSTFGRSDDVEDDANDEEGEEGEEGEEAAAPGVRLTRANVAGGLRMGQCTVWQGFAAEAARFGGAVVVGRTRVAGRTELVGLDLTGATVQGSLQLGGDTTVDAGLSIMNAEISQNVLIVDSRIGRVEPVAGVEGSLQAYVRAAIGQSVYGPLAQVGGFVATGTTFEGSINLAAVTCTSTIRLDAVEVGASRSLVDAAEAEVALHAIGLTCGIDVVLRQVRAAGSLLLASAEVKGSLAIVDSTIASAPGTTATSLALVGAHISGRLTINDLTTSGLLELGRLAVAGDASIVGVVSAAPDASSAAVQDPAGGEVDETDASETSPGGTDAVPMDEPAGLSRRRTALDGTGALFHGNLGLAGVAVDLLILSSAQIDGLLLLVGCDLALGARMPAVRVGSDLQIRGGSFGATPQSILGAEHSVALQVTGATLGQDVLLDGVTLRGAVWLANSDIGGVVAIDGSSLGDATTSSGGSLQLASSRVRAHVWLKDSQFAGRIALDGAHLNGDMRLTGVTATSGADDLVLTASSMTVDAAFVVEGSKLRGTLAAPGLEVGQILFVADSEIGFAPDDATEHGDWSVGLAGAVLEGGLLVEDTKLAHGLLLDGITLRRQLVVRRATIGPAGDSAWAVIIDDADLRGRVEISGSTLGGGLSFDGATLATDLDLGELTIDVGPEAVALAARRTTVRGDLRLGSVTTAGAADLSRSTIYFLRDAPDRWQAYGRVVLTGLTVDRVETDDPPWSAPSRIAWLDRATLHGSAPFELYAKRYEEAQKPTAARELRIAAAAKGTRSRLVRALLEPIGYGFRPLNAIVPVVVLFLLIFGIVWWAQAHDRFVPTDASVAASVRSSDCHEHAYPCLRPTGYTLDVLVPVIDFDEQGDWRPATQPLRAFLWLATMAGWLFTTVLVLGITSRLRQD